MNEHAEPLTAQQEKPVLGRHSRLRLTLAGLFIGTAAALSTVAPAEAANVPSQPLEEPAKPAPSDPPPLNIRLPFRGLSAVSQGPESVDPRTGDACEYQPNTHNEMFGNSESVDLSLPIGTPLVAPIDGVVRYTGPSSEAGKDIFIADELKPNYGNSIVIERKGPDGQTYQVLLAHLSEITVKEGQFVFRGMEIGKSGNSGTVKGHVHFDLRTIREDGSFTTLPIRTLFPWLSGDILKTCLNGERYDAIVLGPELRQAIGSRFQQVLHLARLTFNDPKQLLGQWHTNHQLEPLRQPTLPSHLSHLRAQREI